MSDGGRKKGKAVVVGGSIAGVASAHALTRAGWEVVVVEKSIAPPTRSPTGAGLSLDTVSQKIVNSWLRHPHLLQTSTLPLSIDLNEATDGEKNIRWTLARDENLNFIAAHWADLHSLLYNALPPDIFLWGHLYLSFYVSNDKSNVKVKTKILQTGEIIEIVGDLLIAADGCLSSIRRSFLPEFKLRYSGYCAWRGVLNFSDNEHSEAMIGIREAYPDLGKCLYFNLGYRTHTFLSFCTKRSTGFGMSIDQSQNLRGTQ
ncbi:Aurachin C monooxygenase/isomerase [Camellia lanceoleosa]|uniref:Aurachin C monooxygenase/isomerase n=1 Tax=Camellia lanceoleosa TaxID=1840588 RepID=A0ACC0FEK1_9ERIC|nr:Aurachin C monooxygenase/isomerase [Camellia lanceoleosa]